MMWELRLGSAVKAHKHCRALGSLGFRGLGFTGGPAQNGSS